MKTAMQELLLLVEQMFENAKTQETESAMNDIINIITQQSLEKEKEQIMHAWYNGFDELRPYVDHSEEYYNKTYNQNDNNERVTTDNDRVY